MRAPQVIRQDVQVNATPADVVSLTSDQVRDAVPELSYRMLYTWTMNGYIEVQGGAAAVLFENSHNRYRYPERVLPILRMMVALTRHGGFSPRSASALAHATDGAVQYAGYTVTVHPAAPGAAT